MPRLYLPEPADERIQALVDANPDFEIRGWCGHCGGDRLMINAISKPCNACGAEYGLVAGSDHLRPPRPVEVALEVPSGIAHQTTIFDA